MVEYFGEPHVAAEEWVPNLPAKSVLRDGGRGVRVGTVALAVASELVLGPVARKPCFLSCCKMFNHNLIGFLGLWTANW